MSGDVITGEIVDPLTDEEFDDFDRLESTIERGFAGPFVAGQALAEINARRLYRAHHSSFAQYCERQWQMDRSRAYQLMAAAQVHAELSTAVDSADGTEIGSTPLPVNEAQARELTRFAGDPVLAAAVMREASKDGPATAPKIKAAAKFIAPPAPKKQQEPAGPPPLERDERGKRIAATAHKHAVELSQFKSAQLDEKTIRLLETICERWRTQ